MATIAAGIVAPSQILRKLASYPRQNELALALREVGRIERTLFMIDCILDAGLPRQAQIGLNTGAAHHALKRAISFHRRGEIRKIGRASCRERVCHYVESSVEV